MAIQEQRFKPLTDEYNSIVTSIKESDFSEIINSASNTLSTGSKETLEAAKKQLSGLSVPDLFNSIRQAKDGLIGAIGLGKFLTNVRNAQSTIRQVRGLARSTLLRNIGELNRIKDIDKFLKDLFNSDPNVRNILSIIRDQKQLNEELEGFFDGVSFGKPFSQVSINNRNNVIGTKQPVRVTTASKPLKQANELLTAINPENETKVIDRNEVVRQGVLIASIAYDSGLTSVIDAVKKLPSMDDEVLNRIVSVVITQQSEKGNSLAVIDILESVKDNANILIPISVIRDTCKEFDIPEDSKYDSLDKLVDVLIKSFEIIDPFLNISDDGLLSIRHLSDSSDGFKDSVGSKLVRRSFSLQDLNNDVLNDEQLLNIASGVDYSKQLLELNVISKSSFCYC